MKFLPHNIRGKKILTFHHKKNTLYSSTKTMSYIKISHLAGKFRTTYNTKFLKN